MIRPAAVEEKHIYFLVQWSLVVIFIVGGLIPIPASVISMIKAQAPNWQNIQYLQITLLLAGIGIAVQTYLNNYKKKYDTISLAHHILITVLIICVSATSIILWKYLFGIMPDLDPGQMSFLYTVLPDSLTALFSKTNLSQPPFLMPMYGPLYYSASKLLMKITGESIFALRLMSIFSLIVICSALKIITQIYSSISWSWITPAIFLALFPLVTWSGPPTKPEYFAALFSICGFLVYYKLGFTGKKSWVIISGLLFLSALLIKFTIIVGLMATLTHLLLRRKYQEFTWLVMISIGLFLIIYFWINTVTNGGLLLFSILGNSVQPQIWKIITTGILGYLNNTFTIIASAAVVILLAHEKSLKNFAGLVGIAFFIGVGLFIVSLGRPGSSANYYLEGVVFGSLAIGLLIASTGIRSIDKGILWVIIFYLLLTLPTRIAFIAQSYGDAGEEEKIIGQIRSLDVQDDEYILSDVQYTYAVYQAKKKPLALDNFYFTLLAENDLIDPSVLDGYIYNGQVPYVILHRTLDEHATYSYGGRYFTKELIVYLQQNYRCETRMKRWDGSSFILCSRIPSVP